jgi:hypothetical protein
LAAEIATSTGSTHVANVLLQAKEHAHLYRAIVQPDNKSSELLTRFMTDRHYQTVREQFFEGQGPSMVPTRTTVRSSTSSTTIEDRLKRIDNRLRAVVCKACHNSDATCEIVHLLEDMVIRIHQHKERPYKLAQSRAIQGEDWWKPLRLLQEPVITRKASQRTMTHFHFDAEVPSGGFYRLLLHAICQFHGLSAVSQTVNDSDMCAARVLTVQGRTLGKVTHRLAEIVPTLKE